MSVTFGQAKPPVVLFAFRRPDCLRRILAALRAQRGGAAERLIVFVDGPRHDADAPLVEECRELARGVDWADTELHLWEQNRGLVGMLNDIDLVMRENESAVFVEDDCLPSPGFYAFMCEALSRYADLKRVFSIGGYQPIRRSFFRGCDQCAVFGARFLCWGWATWRDRWAFVRPYSLGDRVQELRSVQVSDFAGHDLRHAAQLLEEGSPLNSWDTGVALAALKLRLVHIAPTHGLVRNIGVGRGAHRSRVSQMLGRLYHNRNVVDAPPAGLVWPDGVDLDCEYAHEYTQFVLNASGAALRGALRRARRVFSRHLRRGWARLHDVWLLRDRVPTSTKRVLLSYIVHPFQMRETEPSFRRHINVWHSREMVRVLNHMGYAVDVVDYRDAAFVPQRDYDLFIGHGGINFTTIVEHLPEYTKRIYFATGAHWRFSNEQETARFVALEERRGVRLPLDRVVRASEDGALASADGIIVLGNDFTRRTYADFPLVLSLNSTVLYDDHVDWCPRDATAGRQHFLYYAGRGNVHKGLDLLLEAFAGLEQHLWICTRMDKQFARVYSRELHELPNIHHVGWVRPRGREYYRVMRTCSFAILPSCSEGGAQSVLECMVQGLIPVVSEACGTDVDGCGVLVQPCTIEEIRHVVKRLSGLESGACREMSQRAYRAAVSRHSEERYTQDLASAIESIVGMQP